MKLLLFLLRLLFFFLGAPTNLWRHLGGIQANDQWKIPAEFVIENVNPDRILIDFRNEKIEIPRLFKQRRKYENVILCLYDPRGHGPLERDVFKDECRWTLTVAPKNAYAKIESIKNLKSVLTKIPSAVTLDVIYHGHGSPGGIGPWYYEEFTKQLSAQTQQIDNMNIDLNACFAGGFWNCTYTIALQKIRVVSGSSKNGNITSKSLYMRSINPPVFQKDEVPKEFETFKTFQDLEVFQQFNVGGSSASAGVFIFHGFGLQLAQIPEINDMPPEDKLFNRYFQSLGSFEPFKPGAFRRNARKFDIATTFLKLGEDLDFQTLLLMTHKYQHSQILTDALDLKINGKKFSDFEIEEARKADVYVDAENFDKNGEICGKKDLSFLECREWAKKINVDFNVKDDAPGPKGCFVDVWDMEKFHRESCKDDECWVLYNVIYNIGSDKSDASSAPACKKSTNFEHLDRFILYFI